MKTETQITILSSMAILAIITLLVLPAMFIHRTKPVDPEPTWEMDYRIVKIDGCEYIKDIKHWLPLIHKANCGNHGQRSIPDWPTPSDTWNHSPFKGYYLTNLHAGRMVKTNYINDFWLWEGSSTNSVRGTSK